MDTQFKIGLMNNIDRKCISGIEPSAASLIQNVLLKIKMTPKQVEIKRDVAINPRNLNFNQFLKRIFKNWKRYVTSNEETSF